MSLKDDGYCFACGENNLRGLRLKFSRQGEKFVTRFTPEKSQQGYTGIVHGGITAAVLDEVMGKSLVDLDIPVVTAELKVRYKKPLKVGREYIFSGWIKQRKSRMIYMAARAEATDGTVMAEGEARMVIVRGEDNNDE